MNIFLVALTYFAFVFFIVACTVRIIKTAKLPVHLRWELAPLPLKKSPSGRHPLKNQEPKKAPQKSLIAVGIFMAKEIFFQDSIWKHNRTLWPFSISMHIGVFLIILSALLHIVNGLLIIAAASVPVLEVLRSIAAVIALIGYIIGGLGAIGLIIKRVVNINLNPFSSFVTYFRLIFLAAIFVSGIAAWFSATDFASEMSEFVRNVLTLNTSINLTISLATHIVISLLFLIYLPLTDMTHFITKYFMYHSVRWNDEPLNRDMINDLNELEKKTVTWSAPHIPARKTWEQVATEKQSHEKTA
jgi:nitrate reductase gamma subunit